MSNTFAPSETAPLPLDDPMRISALRKLVASKAALRGWYAEIYTKYQTCLQQCPAEGHVVELGSGASFIKEYIPDALTTDVIPYEGLDRLIDATRMDFADDSVRAIFMMNVFHHIPDADAFFREASRTLKKGGRIFIVDPYPGLFSKYIYQYLHHEPFVMTQKEWRFESAGPLSDANGAMAWIIFYRDLPQFAEKYPHLRIVRRDPHSPFRYWFSGGLRKWSLIPKWTFSLATAVDNFLVKLSPRLGSFVDVEVVKC